jgi:hypothetical protein
MGINPADNATRQVATYHWVSGYYGPQTKTLCRSCGTQVEATRKESTFGHAELWASNDADWHEGTCEWHEDMQRTITRVGQNMGAE